MPPMAEPAASWRRLARQLRQAAPPLACHEASERLPLFVTDELAGYDVDNLYEETAAHLDFCDRCMAEYVALSQMLRRALRGEGAQGDE